MKNAAERTGNEKGRRHHRRPLERSLQNLVLLVPSAHRRRLAGIQGTMRLVADANAAVQNR